jgi:serine protease Do
MRGTPGWTGIVIGVLCGALLGALLVIVRDQLATAPDGELAHGGGTGRELVAERRDTTAAGARATGDAVSSATDAGRDTSFATGRRNAIVRATEKVAPAVVSINVLAQHTVRYPAFDLWERLGLVPRREYYQDVRNFGSGFIVSAEGHVITNSHVVEGAVQVIVTLSDGRQFPAEVLEVVDRYDIAVLKIEGDDLPVAPLGSSRDLVIGEWAIAIGSPFGYLLADTQPTVTVGVISALNRDIKQQGSERTYLGMIQTDAAINPGNSGGPLVDTEGRVVGVNTFIFTESGGSIGIGFAVPIERAQWIIAEVREFGRYREPNWGFTLVQLSPGIVRYLGLSDPVGFVVTDVEPGSAAWKAGIRPRDIIREIDGVRLDSRDTVIRLVYEAMVGERLTFVAERNGERFSGEIVLEEKP